MKIAMIVNSFPSVSEKYLLNQIISLLKQNVDIDIYAAVRSRDIKIHALFYQYNLQDKIVNLNIPLNVFKRYLFLPILLFKNIIRNPLYVLNAFSVKKYNTAALNLKNIFFLNKLVNKKYDIIHCQFGQNGLIGSYLKDCNICKKLIVTFHGSDITVIPQKYGKKIYDYMFKRTDFITAGSNFIRNKLVQYGCAEEKIRIIPMGLNITPYSRSTYGTYFLSIGRLVDVKGLIYSIEAFSLLAGKYPEIKYYIAGNGPLYKNLSEAINALGMETKIFLLGEKTDKEIESLYQNAYALVFPSIHTVDGSEEGQGMVIQEAEFYEIPVIASKTGGIPEGIIDGKTGFLVNEKNIDELCKKMTFLLENKDKCREFGKNGRAFVKEYYDIDILSQKLINTVYLSQRVL
jgi:colanic acid/amylovoran biosynthesis glycosyltransferase